MSGVKRLLDGMDLVKLYRANPETGAVFDPIQDAHSHWKGDWYQWPKDYPAVYFDADGYVVIQRGVELIKLIIRKLAKGGETVHFQPALRNLPDWQSLVPPPKDFKR